MNSVADPVLAVALYLRSEIGELCDNRIAEAELPELKDPEMPQTRITIVPSGGYELAGGMYAPIADTIMDFYCYGSTRLEAQELARAALVAMKRLKGSSWAETQLRWARITAGVTVEMDPKADWPTGIFTCQVLHGEPLIAR